ncbi:MAG TPA: hypothetical protein VLM85_28640 [Polyangiaceae bacterium]|nr:hypothetical protein [Polyangiaceae bacterium]
MSRWLRRFLAVVLILHGFAHAGAGMWLTHHALAYERTPRLLVGALLWAWVTTRFVHAGFAMLHKVRVASRLASGAALLSLVLLALAWSPAMWFGVLVDAVVILTVAMTWRMEVLLLRVPRDRAPRRALRYVALAATAGLTLLWPVYAHWGSRPSELRATLPGDDAMEMKPDDVVYQNAVTIRAPPERVWSWLVQIGQGRGGFYSYRWLEYLFGLRIQNIERVDPEMQTLHEGDLIRAAPDGWLGTRDLGWKVWRVEEGRLLVLRYWGSFVLLPAGGESTRLIARTPLGDPREHPGFAVFGLFWEPAHFVMERKMLVGIKERAERAEPALPPREGPRPSAQR